MRFAIRQQIDRALRANRYFSDTDFDVTPETSKDGGLTVTVAYRGDDESVFRAVFARSQGTIQPLSIYCTYSPGKILARENFSVADLEHVLVQIEDWVHRLADDLRAQPEARRLEELRRQVEKLLAQQAIDALSEDDYFTREEADALKERLAALEEQVEKQRCDSQLQEDIRNDVEVLTQQLYLLNKKSWVRRFVGRCASWFQAPANRDMLKDAVKIVRLLNPGEDCEHD